MYDAFGGGIVYTEVVYKWPKLRCLAGDAKLRIGDPLRKATTLPSLLHTLSVNDDRFRFKSQLSKLLPFVDSTRSVSPAVGPSHN